MPKSNISLRRGLVKGQLVMTISDRVFELLKENHISQKSFSELTGIPQSTISDWKKKGTNPSSEKIMIICDVLNVSPYYLLSGATPAGNRGGKGDYRVIANESEEGELVELFEKLSEKNKQRLIGYIKALDTN